MLFKCCTQYASKFGKLSSSHRTGKGQFSFQSQRRAMPMNAQTTAQLHSSHKVILASKVTLKILQARLQQYLNWELPYVQFGFKKGRGTRDQIASIHWIIGKAREFQKNIYLCFIDYTKAFDCVDHSKLWKILQEMGIPDHLNCLLRNLYHTRSSQPLEPDMEQWTGSKLGKEYVKAIYCHSAYLTYMQSTSCEMPGWMKHKLESKFPGDISITSDTQMTPPLWQKGKKN